MEERRLYRGLMGVQQDSRDRQVIDAMACWTDAVSVFLTRLHQKVWTASHRVRFCDQKLCDRGTV